MQAGYRSAHDGPDPRMPTVPTDVSRIVALALEEDVGTGDLTAALVAPEEKIRAEVISREPGVLCGQAWADEVFRQLDPRIGVQWDYADGDGFDAESRVCTIAGSAPAILTGERTALNFLQALSATATTTRKFCEAVAGTAARILDTRKTLPGLRSAQKYAVACGGGTNHRAGLFDAVLIKENHISAVGGISEAVARARRQSPDVMIEVEVEDLDQLREALATEADRIMLDNFDTDRLRRAAELRNESPFGHKELEASGGLEIGMIRQIAETGVDFISVGALTKDVSAIDFSMRFVKL